MAGLGTWLKLIYLFMKVLRTGSFEDTQIQDSTLGYTIKIVLVGLVILDGVTIMLDLLLILGIPVMSRFYPWLHYKDSSGRFSHSRWCNYKARSALISRYPSYIKILPLVIL